MLPIVKVFLRREEARVVSERIKLRVVTSDQIPDEVLNVKMQPWVEQSLVCQEMIDFLEDGPPISLRDIYAIDDGGGDALAQRAQSARLAWYETDWRPMFALLQDFLTKCKAVNDFDWSRYEYHDGRSALSRTKNF